MNGIPAGLSIGLSDYALLRGCAFTYSNVFTIAGNGVLNLLLDPSDYTPDESQIYNMVLFETPTILPTSGPVLGEWFANPVVTAAGSAISPAVFNRNAQSSRASQMVITTGPTITSDGTLFSKILIPSSSSGGNLRPFEAGGQTLYILSGGLILVRLTNQNAQSITVQVRNNFYEL